MAGDPTSSKNIPDSTEIENLISKVKSSGTFDEIRRLCISDADTLPAYLNLQQRVNAITAEFLEGQQWDASCRKSQLRENLRSHIIGSETYNKRVDNLINYIIQSQFNSIFNMTEKTLFSVDETESVKGDDLISSVEPSLGLSENLLRVEKCCEHAKVAKDKSVSSICTEAHSVNLNKIETQSSNLFNETKETTAYDYTKPSETFKDRAVTDSTKVKAKIESKQPSSTRKPKRSNQVNQIENKKNIKESSSKSHSQICKTSNTVLPKTIGVTTSDKNALGKLELDSGFQRKNGSNKCDIVDKSVSFPTKSFEQLTEGYKNVDVRSSHNRKSKAYYYSESYDNTVQNDSFKNSNTSETSDKEQKESLASDIVRKLDVDLPDVKDKVTMSCIVDENFSHLSISIINDQDEDTPNNKPELKNHTSNLHNIHEVSSELLQSHFEIQPKSDISIIDNGRTLCKLAEVTQKDEVGVCVNNSHIEETSHPVTFQPRRSSRRKKKKTYLQYECATDIKRNSKTKSFPNSHTLLDTEKHCKLEDKVSPTGEDKKITTYKVDSDSEESMVDSSSFNSQISWNNFVDVSEYSTCVLNVINDD